MSYSSVSIMPQWLNEWIKEVFKIKPIFTLAEINNSQQIETEMGLHGNHASPRVLPRNHFHCSQLSMEGITSTAICMSLHLGQSVDVSFRGKPLGPALEPPGLLGQQGIREVEFAEDRNTCKRWMWGARTGRRTLITSPDGQSPLFVLTCHSPRARNLLGMSFICRWRSLIWTNNTVVLWALLCFVSLL